MSQYFEKKELYDKVLQLSNEEMLEPMKVLEDFFGDYRLHECRAMLWTMVETCLTTENTEFNDPAERGNLLLRYKALERLLEANSILLQKHRSVPPSTRDQ